MTAQRPAESGLRMLIPWDDDTLLDDLLAFARKMGGSNSHIMLLPAGANGIESGVSRRASNTVPFEIVQVSRDEPMAAISAVAIAAIAAQRAADVIIMATNCHPGGKLDCSCLAAQLALDSPIPVMLLRWNMAARASFPSSITRLLILLDGSSRAIQSLPFATRLARRLQVAVHFVMVIDPAQVLPPAFARDPEAEDLIAGLREDAHCALKRAEHLLESHGVAVSSSLLYGPVIASIEETIQPGDLVMMTTQGRGSAPHSRLGSVAAQMIADVLDPLVIMRGTPLSEFVVQGYLA